MRADHPQPMSQQMSGIERPHDPRTQGRHAPETQHAIDAGLTLDRLTERRESLGSLLTAGLESSFVRLSGETGFWARDAHEVSDLPIVE